MNDYDMTGRYVAKQDPRGFFAWLLGIDNAHFHLWIDSRRTALPNQQDLTNDLVAAFRVGTSFEALAVELQALAQARTLRRLLAYLSRLWTEPGSAESLPLTAVGGVVLNLTGSTPATQLSLRPTVAPGCRLDLAVVQRNLRDEDAAALITGVAAGRISRWELAWVPLMRGGADADIITAWRREAERLPDEGQRADLGSTALTFAALARNRSAWEHGLRGFNMKTSPFLDEFRAEGRKEGFAEAAQTILLEQGLKKFGKAPTKKQQAELAALTDLAHLRRLSVQLLDVDSWDALLKR